MYRRYMLLAYTFHVGRDNISWLGGHLVLISEFLLRAKRALAFPVRGLPSTLPRDKQAGKGG